MTRLCSDSESHNPTTRGSEAMTALAGSGERVDFRRSGQRHHHVCFSQMLDLDPYFFLVRGFMCPAIILGRYPFCRLNSDNALSRYAGVIWTESIAVCSPLFANVTSVSKTTSGAACCQASETPLPRLQCKTRKRHRSKS